MDIYLNEGSPLWNKKCRIGRAAKKNDDTDNFKLSSFEITCEFIYFNLIWFQKFSYQG